MLNGSRLIEVNTRSFIVGSVRILENSLEIFITTALGIDLGPNNPYQILNGTPENLPSCNVGASGASAERLLPSTAKTFTLLD